MLSDSDSIKRTSLEPIAPEKVSVKAEKLVNAWCPACSCVLETFPGSVAYCSSCQRGLRPHPFSYLHFSLPLRRAIMPLSLRHDTYHMHDACIYTCTGAGMSSAGSALRRTVGRPAFTQSETRLTKSLASITGRLYCQYLSSRKQITGGPGCGPSLSSRVVSSSAQCQRRWQSRSPLSDSFVVFAQCRSTCSGIPTKAAQKRISCCCSSRSRPSCRSSAQCQQPVSLSRGRYLQRRRLFTRHLERAAWAAVLPHLPPHEWRWAWPRL